MQFGSHRSHDCCAAASPGTVEASKARAKPFAKMGKAERREPKWTALTRDFRRPIKEKTCATHKIVVITATTPAARDNSSEPATPVVSAATPHDAPITRNAFCIHKGQRPSDEANPLRRPVRNWVIRVLPKSQIVLRCKKNLALYEIASIFYRSHRRNRLLPSRGWLMLTILGSLAGLDRELIGPRTSGGRARRRSQVSG